jgi:hypothetical protein
MNFGLLVDEIFKFYFLPSADNDVKHNLKKKYCYMNFTHTVNLGNSNSQ